MMTVGEMSAMGEVQSENGIARLQHGCIGFHVGLRSRMRLHVGVFGAEELFGAVARQVLDHVGVLASAVVALAGIAFRIFVGEYRAHRFEHRFANEILGGDQLQSVVLAAGFVVDGGGNIGIGSRQRAGYFGVHQHLS